MAKNTVHMMVTLDDDKVSMLEKLDPMDRLLGLTKALGAGARVFVKRAKQLCPKPGYPGDKPDKKPLVETIGTVIRRYDHALVIVCGPQYPAGAHGHLVEFGHKLVYFGWPTDIFVQPKPFMRPAMDQTKTQQEEAMIRSLQSSVSTLDV